MTETETMMDSPTGPVPPSPASNGTWRRWLQTIKPKWWDDPTEATKGNIVSSAFVAAVALSVGSWFIIGQIQAVGAKQLAQTRHDAAEQVYAAAAIDHTRQEIEYRQCLSDAQDRVERSDGLRASLTSITDLSDLFPGSTLAQEYTKTRQAIVEASFPPLDVKQLQADCVLPGPTPVPPT